MVLIILNQFRCTEQNSIVEPNLINAFSINVQLLGLNIVSIYTNVFGLVLTRMSSLVLKLFESIQGKFMLSLYMSNGDVEMISSPSPKKIM